MGLGSLFQSCAVFALTDQPEADERSGSPGSSGWRKGNDIIVDKGSGCNGVAFIRLDFELLDEAGSAECHGR